MTTKQQRKTARRKVRQAEAYRWFVKSARDAQVVVGRAPPFGMLAERTKQAVMEAYAGRRR